MKSRHFYELCWTLAIFFALGQLANGQALTSELEMVDFPYQQTVLPKDTSQLWMSEGAPQSDTVLIFCEGGPETHLGYEVDGKTQWRYLPGYRNYYRIFLHQAQTYNKDMFNYGHLFTEEHATQEVAHTSEMLLRAIKFFKDRNKKVIVIGNSYGAFVMAHYLATRPALADKYFICGGRLDVQPEVYQNHLMGYNGAFDVDGQTYLAPDTTNQEHLAFPEERYWQIFRVKQLLKGVIGRYRYTELLSGIDLSNVTYFYATNDENVGALSASEVRFLEANGAAVIATHDGHYDIWKRMIDAFRAGKVSF